MGNIYAGMAVGLGFILFCILLSTVWCFFKSYKKRLLPQKKGTEVIPFAFNQDGEKRDRKRTDIVWPVFLETKNGIVKAETKDLSRVGAFVKCSKPLLPGEQFRITIEVPSRGTISLKSEVVWSNVNLPEEKVVNRGMGIRFMQNVEEDITSFKSALEEYIEELNNMSVQKAAFI